jgi:hypothetical protein
MPGEVALLPLLVHFLDKATIAGQAATITTATADTIQISARYLYNKITTRAAAARTTCKRYASDVYAQSPLHCRGMGGMKHGQG